MNQKANQEIYTVINEDGGQGKTTTSLAIAATLHKAGESVLLTGLDKTTSKIYSIMKNARTFGTGFDIPLFDPTRKIQNETERERLANFVINSQNIINDTPAGALTNMDPKKLGNMIKKTTYFVVPTREGNNLDQALALCVEKGIPREKTFIIPIEFKEGEDLNNVMSKGGNLLGCSSAPVPHVPGFATRQSRGELIPTGESALDVAFCEVYREAVASMRREKSLL